jgi:aryl-alcohol dehydrogenase (NADP+)
LVERKEYEGELAEVVRREGLSAIPYFALAKGFLTGKYRPGAPEVKSARAAGASAYLNERGLKVLAALDEVAGAHHTTVAAVALAWLVAQPTVVAPIASARTTTQLADILLFVELRLSKEELRKLSAASEA